MSEIQKREIIRFLKHDDYSPMKVGALARALGVKVENREAFGLAVEELRSAGHIVVGSKETLGLQGLSGRITGTFRANVKGFGFVMPDEPMAGDLFIPPRATGEAMTGDTVVAEVERKRGGPGGQMRYSGRVVEIVHRAESRYVGTLMKKRGRWVVVVDGGAILEPVEVEDVGAKGASEKDKVVIELISYPTEGSCARGVITEVLGKAGQYESEIQSVIRQFHLAGEFDSEVVAEAHQCATGFDAGDAGSREDICGKVIITIDPPEAKDFDDAISIERDGDGNRELGIHIADVSYFVKAGSLLDKEAAERGNSAYLPGRTIPMLPEVLSNGVCSLQPEQKRFCKSVYITYDEDGKVLSRRYAESVMCSRQRLSYEQADKCLAGKHKGIKPEVVELLSEMESLAKRIEERRRAAGMIHLDMPDTEIVMDKSGRVVDAEPADDCYPHTIIEMFMVEANEAVVSLFDGLKTACMRRIHPDPDPLSMKQLSLLIRSLGLSISRKPDRKELQVLLEGVRGHEVSFAVNMMVLRSLQRAEYSPLRIGHYALASTNYGHFTSPIRRYADLLIHRQLASYIGGGAKAVKGAIDESELTEIGRHISFTEQQADKAEQELKKVLILQMLSGSIGSEIDGVVTGVTSFGVFVRCQKFGIEGLIQLEDIAGDKWQFSAKSRSLVGVRSGVVIRLGMPMKAKIVSVNISARQLTLVPTEGVVKVKGGQKMRQRRKVKKYTAKKRGGRASRRTR
jgi:ribonuclease R